MSDIWDRLDSIPEPSRFQDSLEYKTDRRNSIAEGFAYALAVRGQTHQWNLRNLAPEAIQLADALIAELDANPPKTGDA